MGTGRTDEFRKDAVRIALTRGLSRGNERHRRENRILSEERTAGKKPPVLREERP